jgi:phospholipase C
VQSGKLPTVSWLVAPENFSDHPSAPWYGAWYVSEALDILTQNPEVWKKTILILCYDENDGYFDHVPPFVAPHPGKPETGKASAGIDLAVEHVWPAQEGLGGHVGPIGLGYRVPLVIASPWTRGGYVCSQVFDHTSIVQFLEKFLSHKTGREIHEPNINAWRRVVCGDLTSAFRPWNGEKIELPKPVECQPFLESIDRAQYKPLPGGFRKLEEADLQLAREHPEQCPWLPRQEKGTRPSCALPYELSVTGMLSADRKTFAIQFSAGKQIFGDRSAGAPFHVYSPARMRVPGSGGDPAIWGSGLARSYAVAAGDRLDDTWTLTDFENAAYHLCVHGPNGFFREFRGTADDPLIDITLEPTRHKTALLRLANHDSRRKLTVEIIDAAYGAEKQTIALGASSTPKDRAELPLDLSRTHGWHDIRVRVAEAPAFEKRYAGRIETGTESITDPAMGKA